MIRHTIWATLLAATMRAGVRYRDRRWKFIARTRRKMDGYRCAVCGVRGVVLHVHHRRAVSNGGGHHLGNLQTLCLRCHERAHRRDLNHNGRIGT